MSKAKAAGRPPKDKEIEAPMPKSWKDTERLAGVLAYLEASEGGANAALEEDARDKFAAQMDYVHSNVKEFVGPAGPTRRDTRVFEGKED